MLSLNKVSVRYQRNTAVDAVDLRVPDGAVLALLGPSGCGKSSLLRAMAGLEPLSAGQIYWDDVDLAKVPIHRRGFGLMFQDGVLFAHRTVAGNIAYGLQRKGLPRAQIRKRVGELLELVGLAGFGGRAVGTLSGGQAQRVALARALAPQPRLLLLDEPLAALDTALRERLLADLREVLTRTGTTAVFVTHDQDEAFAVSDLVTIMRDGRIAQSGPTEYVWRAPVDAWVAGFVGYPTVLSASKWAAVSGVTGPAGAQIALRSGALTVAADGTVAGRVESLLPGPDRVGVQVELEGVGVLPAVAPAGTQLRVGELVRLRHDPRATAWLDRSAMASSIQ